MEFNKLVSLVLGFIVLILVFVWISNRVRSSQTVSNDTSVTITQTPTPTPTEEEEGTTWNPFAFLFNGDATPTPTVSPRVGEAQKISGMPTATPVQIKIVENSGSNGNTNQGQTTKGGITYTNNTTGTVQTIPETGAATLLLPLSLAAMSAGIYLKKRS